MEADKQSRTSWEIIDTQDNPDAKCYLRMPGGDKFVDALMRAIRKSGKNGCIVQFGSDDKKRIHLSRLNVTKSSTHGIKISFDDGIFCFNEKLEKAKKNICENCYPGSILIEQDDLDGRGNEGSRMKVVTIRLLCDPTDAGAKRALRSSLLIFLSKMSEL